MLDSYLTGLPSLSKTQFSSSSVEFQVCTLQPPVCLNTPGQGHWVNLGWQTKL